MSTRPTPEQDELRRHAEWVEANYRVVAKIADVAGDLKFHAKVVGDAIDDPKGRRVTEMRRLHLRLTDTFAELDALPEPLNRAA